MHGRHGAVPISEFESLVVRNAYKPNVRFIQTRWGRANGAPAYTCTLSVGDPDLGNNFNVAVPELPEETVMNPKTNRVVARGWRRLLVWLIMERTIRPSRELLKWLGYKDFERAKEGLGCV